MVVNRTSCVEAKGGLSLVTWNNGVASKSLDTFSLAFALVLCFCIVFVEMVPLRKLFEVCHRWSAQLELAQ